LQKVVKFFLLLEIKKTTYFTEIFKIQGAKAPPSDAHAKVVCQHCALDWPAAIIPL